MWKLQHWNVHLITFLQNFFPSTLTTKTTKLGRLSLKINSCQVLRLWVSSESGENGLLYMNVCCGKSYTGKMSQCYAILWVNSGFEFVYCIRMSAYTNVRLYECLLIQMSAYTNVRLYECPLIRMSAYMNVRLYECLLIWMSAYMNVRLHECLLIRMSAYTNVHLYECLLIWMSPYTNFRLYQYPLIWMSAYTNVHLYKCPLIKMSASPGKCSNLFFSGGGPKVFVELTSHQRASRLVLSWIITHPFPSRLCTLPREHLTAGEGSVRLTSLLRSPDCKKCKKRLQNKKKLI